jgi:hypothetical protein
MGGKHVSRGSTTWRWVDNAQDYNGHPITDRWSNFTTYLYWDFISEVEGMILYLPRPVHLYAGKFSDIPAGNTACGSICQYN